MSRPRGGIIAGTLPAWTTTSTSGIFTLREAQELRAANTWPRGPAAPTSLSAAAGNAQILLSWTAPATTHGTITNYLVEYTPSGGSAAYVLTGSTSTSYTLTGLTIGTAYTVRVAAVNFTAGDYSSAVTETPVTSSVLAISGTDTANWTGTGTSASKFTRAATISRGGCGEVFPFVFEALANTTFRAVGSTQDSSNDGDDNMQIQILNSALTSVVSTLFSGSGGFNVTASISAGQKVRWQKSCNSSGDHSLNGGVTVWAE